MAARATGRLLHHLVMYTYRVSDLDLVGCTQTRLAFLIQSSLPDQLHQLVYDDEPSVILDLVG